MKKFFTLLMAVLWVTFTSYGQIVISEISYNPPESGTDSLEYIEIYNAGNAGVNLKDYKFSKGVDFTFPDTTLGSHKYLLIVKHA
ncbi:MAG: lamin tail domain-containing protein [Saprospiraceae bacterium]|nr:lamin tail domain-containing protein [Saprospiraceae bacterium]